MATDIEPTATTALTPRRTVTFIDSWLSGHKPTTARAYRRDLEHFATWANSEPLTAINQLLAAGHGPANMLAHQWRGDMIAAELSPATVNRRLAALRSVINHANRAGLADWTLNVQSVKAKQYRDTTGPGVEVVRQLLAATADTPKGSRDRALIRLMFDRGLRRGEVVALDVADYDADRRSVWIIAKGSNESEPVTISRAAGEALDEWLSVRPGGSAPGPLFVNLDRAGKGHRLTGRSVGRIVGDLGRSVGVDNVRPHGLRHTAITEVLNRNGGNYRAALAFSRHAQLQTIKTYDDNRADLGGEMAEDLATALD